MYHSDTTHSEKPNHQYFSIWNSHWQCGHLTMAIPDEVYLVTFSVILFCSYAVHTSYAVQLGSLVTTMLDT